MSKFVKDIDTQIGIKRNDQCQGIALVVVLGFLAVLTIMAMGMAISMRTERLASSSHLDMVRARLYCQAALANSMMFMDEAAQGAALFGASGATNYFMPNFREYLETFESGREMLAFFDEAEQKGYPFGQGKLILPSIEPGTDTFTNSLISGLATNWIPYMPGLVWRGLYAHGEHGGEEMREKAQWIHTTTSDPSGNVVTNGRYMYFVFNASGRYDLNYLGRQIPPFNHDMKLDGRRLQSLGAVNPDTYRAATNAVRYETSADLGEDMSRSETFLSEASIRGETPWEIETFSYFPPMRRIVVGADKIELSDQKPAFLSTNYKEWVESDIVAAFDEAIKDADWQSSADRVNSRDLYNLLVDYVDDDLEPYSLNAPNIEPTPMISEIMIASKQISIEVWSPFVGTSTNRYTRPFNLKGTVGSIGFERNGIPSPAGISPKRIDIALPEELDAGDYSVRATMTGTDNDGSTIDLDKIDLSNIQLDEYWEVNDPRFNHLVSQWRRDGAGSGTLGNINRFSREGYADNAASVGAGDYVRDGDYLMYCANRSLRCTGELGYLPVAPWRTIKLYQDPRDPRPDRGNMDPVLDYFTMFPVDSPVYGMSNPNERYHHPSRSQAEFLDEDRSGWWGLHLDDKPFPNQAVYGYRYYGPYRLTNILSEFMNISDLGKFLYDNKIRPLVDNDKPEWVKEYKEQSDHIYSELRIEYMMRRASALYHLRQGLYIVCIWAQSVGEKATGAGEHNYEIKAEAQAVAMVWRDPYPDADGHHRRFVRYMRWME